MFDSSSPRRQRFPFLFIAGLLLSALACGLLIFHVKRFVSAKDRALSLGSRLSSLRTNVTLLRASLEADKAFGSDALLAKEEQVSEYVLPPKPDKARMIHVLQTLVLSIDHDRHTFLLDGLTFSPALETMPDGHTQLQATAVLRGNMADMSLFLSVLDLSGKLTVSDVLGTHTNEDLLLRLQKSVPTSLLAASRFLLGDLLQYSLDPDGQERRLLQNLPLELASDFHALFLQSGLGVVRSVLAPVAEDLRAEQSWPLPLLRVTSLHEEHGLWTVGIALIAR